MTRTGTTGDTACEQNRKEARTCWRSNDDWKEIGGAGAVGSDQRLHELRV
jgi:hypothetical protein